MYGIRYLYVIVYLPINVHSSHTQRTGAPTSWQSLLYVFSTPLALACRMPELVIPRVGRAALHSDGTRSVELLGELCCSCSDDLVELLHISPDEPPFIFRCAAGLGSMCVWMVPGREVGCITPGKGDIDLLLLPEPGVVSHVEQLATLVGIASPSGLDDALTAPDALEGAGRQLTAGKETPDAALAVAELIELMGSATSDRVRASAAAVSKGLGCAFALRNPIFAAASSELFTPRVAPWQLCPRQVPE